MTDIKIVLDSSADLMEMQDVDFACAPLVISTAERDYIDDASLDVAAMANELYNYKGRSRTSCPNVEDWLAAFGDAKRIIAITITGSLSGSFNAARNAKNAYEEKYPDRQVFLIDSLSAGPEIALMAERAREMILAGREFEQICEGIKNYNAELLFVLESMKNLANNGRVSKLAATAAGMLGIRAVGRASEEGTLEMLSKCRGTPKAIEVLAGYMRDMGFSGGRAIISHCLNEPMAERLRAAILSAYPEADVAIRECRGLCSFYAERGGMLIGFETNGKM